MKYVAFVVFLVILIFLVVEFNSRTAELNHLMAEREVFAVRLSSRIQTKAALEHLKSYATSEAPVEEYAYENKMGRNDEFLVIPISPYQSTPTPIPTQVVVVTQETNLQTWLSLFVDVPTPTPSP